MKQMIKPLFSKVPLVAQKFTPATKGAFENKGFFDNQSHYQS